MKLNFQQLEQQVSKQLFPVYLVASDDPIQKHEALQLIQKAAKKENYTARIRLQSEGDLDEEQLYTALYSPSLSAEKTLLELDFRSKIPAKPIMSILENYLSKTSADILVLINASKLDDTATRSAWYKALEKNGIVVTIWPIAREQLPQWLITRSRKYKMTLQSDAAALLTDYVEGNLTAAAQTLEKIFLLKPDKPIDAEMIQSILTDESSFTVFDLTESMITPNTTRTLHILDTLRQDGTEAVIVLWSITRELRTLADIATQQKLGMSWDEAFRKFRVFPRRQQGIKRFLARFSREQCKNCLTHAANIDAMLKGAQKGNGWEALQMLCLRLV